jgi:hypothetical protein
MKALSLTTLFVAVSMASGLAGPLDNQIRQATTPIPTVDVKAQQAEAKVEAKAEARPSSPSAKLPTYFLQGRGNITKFGPFTFQALFSKNADGTYKQTVRFVYDDSKYGITTFMKDSVDLSENISGGFSAYSERMPFINTEYTGLKYNFLHWLKLNIDLDGTFNGYASTYAGWFNFRGSYQNRTATIIQNNSRPPARKSNEGLRLPRRYDGKFRW